MYHIIDCVLATVLVDFSNIKVVVTTVSAFLAIVTFFSTWINRKLNGKADKNVVEEKFKTTNETINTVKTQLKERAKYDKLITDMLQEAREEQTAQYNHLNDRMDDIIMKLAK